MRDGLKDEHREAIIARLAANQRVERVVLFGSRAMGTNTITSDVDLALFGKGLTLTDHAQLAAAIDLIPMAQTVDIVMHGSIQSQPLLEHIQKHGVEWYERESFANATR
ncbi:MAG: nucleotidyltransferase domain-containing protein [Gammaproteobacteria bacterium]|nr:nucleotidyltransferase domain-containing protein [Gammaproteobacteria bacterium]